MNKKIYLENKNIYKINKHTAGMGADADADGYQTPPRMITNKSSDISPGNKIVQRIGYYYYDSNLENIPMEDIVNNDNIIIGLNDFSDYFINNDNNILYEQIYKNLNQVSELNHLLEDYNKVNGVDRFKIIDLCLYNNHLFVMKISNTDDNNKFTIDNLTNFFEIFSRHYLRDEELENKILELCEN